MNKIEIMKELNKRGALPADKKPIFDELVRRGAITLDEDPQQEQALQQEDNLLLQFGKGANDAIASLAGLPVDAMEAVLNLGVDGINSIAGTNLNRFENSVGSSNDLKNNQTVNAAIQGVNDVVGTEIPKLENVPEPTTTAGTVANVAGQIVPAIGSGAALVNQLPKITATGVKGAVQRGGQLAGVGAIEGNVLSSAETPEGVIADTLIGGVAAPVVGSVLTLGGKLARPVIDKIKNAPPSSDALKQVSKELVRDGVDVNTIATKLDDLGDDAFIADVGGENIKRLTDAVFQRTGRGADKIRNKVNSRQDLQLKRVESSIKSQVGDFDNFIGKVDDVVQEMKNQARPLYKAAYEVDFKPTEKLKNALTVNGSPKTSIAKAWKEAQKLANNDGVDLPTLDIDNISTFEIDHIKRGLDSFIEKNTSKIDGANATARSLSELKRSILTEVDQINPVFAEARKVYEDGFRLKNALNDGLKFLRADSDEIAKNISNLTENELNLFRQGAAKSLRQRIASAQDGADAFKRLTGNQAVREKIKVVTGEEGFEGFIDSLKREGTFAQTRRTIENSATAKRQFKDNDLVEAGIETATTGLTARLSSVIPLVRGALNRRALSDEGKVSEIADALIATGSDRVKVINELRKLENLSAKDRSVLEKAIISNVGSGNIHIAQ